MLPTIVPRKPARPSAARRALSPPPGCRPCSCSTPLTFHLPAVSAESSCSKAISAPSPSNTRRCVGGFGVPGQLRPGAGHAHRRAGSSWRFRSRTLARHKEVDLLDISNCWISGPIENTELNFRHLLCIEPAVNKQAPAAVGDVFRSLIPYVTGEPWISRVALPLLSAGNQGFDPVDMLRAILDASIHWLSTGLPLDVMKIVIYEREPDELIARAQETFRWYAANMDVQRSQEDNWDVFVSYSHADADVVGNLVDRMKKSRSDHSGVSRPFGARGRKRLAAPYFRCHRRIAESRLPFLARIPEVGRVPRGVQHRAPAQPGGRRNPDSGIPAEHGTAVVYAPPPIRRRQRVRLGPAG